MTHFKSSIWIMLGATAVVASIGCGGSKATGSGGGDATGGAGATTTTGTGAHHHGSGGQGGSGGDGTGGGAETGGAGTGGAPGTSCDDYASAYCDKLATCAPMMFIAAWENATICKAQIAASCETDKALPGAGTVDQAACLAARTGSCDALLDPVTPAACIPGPGSGAEHDKCYSVSQCGAGLGCFPNGGKPTCPGQCYEPYAIGEGCFGDSLLCDFEHGAECLNEYGHPGADPACWVPTYGALSDSCKDGTDKQCQSGLVCTSSNRCVAALLEDAFCDGADDRCDHRVGLSCAKNKIGQYHCQQKVYVTVGGQCGTVNSVPQSCSAYAYCQGSNPTTCAIRKMEGESCTAAPDNCYPGLVCKTGTCQQPAAPSCN